MRVYACLLGATVNFLGAHSVKVECPQQCQPCERLLPDCSVSMKEPGSNKLHAFSAHTTTICHESVTKQAESHRQQNVQWQGLLQVNTNNKLNFSYTAGTPPLAYSLSAKLV